MLHEQGKLYGCVVESATGNEEAVSCDTQSAHVRDPAAESKVVPRQTRLLATRKGAPTLSLPLFAYWRFLCFYLYSSGLGSSTPRGTTFNHRSSGGHTVTST